MFTYDMNTEFHFCSHTESQLFPHHSLNSPPLLICFADCCTSDFICEFVCFWTIGLIFFLFICRCLYSVLYSFLNVLTSKRLSPSALFFFLSVLFIPNSLLSHTEFIVSLSGTMISPAGTLVVTALNQLMYLAWINILHYRIFHPWILGISLHLFRLF